MWMLIAQIHLEVFHALVNLDTLEMVCVAKVKKKFFFFFGQKVFIFFLLQIDIDECSTNNGGCHIQANCTNTIGNFTCTCKPGYLGNGFNCTGISFFFYFFTFWLNFRWLSISSNQMSTNINWKCKLFINNCREYCFGKMWWFILWKPNTLL